MGLAIPRWRKGATIEETRRIKAIDKELFQLRKTCKRLSWERGVLTTRANNRVNRSES